MTNMTQVYPHNTTNSTTEGNYNFMKNEIHRLQSKVSYLLKDKKNTKENIAKTGEEYISAKSSHVLKPDNNSKNYNKNKINQKSSPISFKHMKTEIDMLQSNIDGLESQLCKYFFL
jgi:hypothetical protein